MTDIVERLDQLVDDLGEGRACCGLDYIDAAVDAAAEITRLRAKVAKADALAEAASYMLGRRLTCLAAYIFTQATMTTSLSPDETIGVHALAAKHSESKEQSE